MQTDWPVPAEYVQPLCPFQLVAFAAKCRLVVCLDCDSYCAHRFAFRLGLVLQPDIDLFVFADRGAQFFGALDSAS
ncbi:hypothetical protein LCGC14_2369030, partial [marine sediment metagenome]